MSELPKKRREKRRSRPSRKAANLSPTNQEALSTSPPKTPPKISDFPEKPPTPPVPSSEIMDRYMENLDVAITKTAALLEYKKKLKVFEGIKPILKREELKELRKMKANLADAVKRQLAEETQGKDRPVESGRGKKVDKVRSDIAEFVKLRAEVDKKLEDEIESTWKKLEVVTMELEVIRKSMLESELDWLGDKVDLPVMSPEFGEQFISKSRKLHNLQMTLILDSFLKN